MKITVVDNIYKINKNESLEHILELSQINCCLNEICSFQVVLKNYDDISNLKLDVISNNDVKVFYEYYHEIKEPSTLFTEKGFYPDCLVPYDLFVKNDLIKNINKNDNIIFLVQVKITSRLSEQLQLSFNINDIEYKKIVNLNINKFNLDDSILAKSLFGIFPEMNLNEDMTLYLEKYNNLLKEYKISSNKLTNTFNSLELIIQEIKEKTLDNDISAIALPLEIVDNKVDVLDIEYKLNKLIIESNKDKINYLKKIIIYNYLLDEPYEDRFHLVKEFADDINNIKHKLIKKCKSKELKESLVDIDNITTVFFQEGLYGKVDTWCPTFIAYQMKELEYEGEILKRNGDKVWWYGCVWPMHPYPNYHLDDDLINIRVLNFMQFYYNIRGNLYWAVNINQRYNLEKLKYEEVDIWNEPKLFYPANGDGYLTYEGKKFNSNEVLPSLRLSAIRDGIYDYQYLMKLEENLIKNARSMNIKYNRQKYFKHIFEDLFHGVVVNRRFDRFKEIKDTIDKLIELTEQGYYVEVNNQYELIIYSNKYLCEYKLLKKTNHYYKYLMFEKDIQLNAKEIIVLNNSANKYTLKQSETFSFSLDDKIDIRDYFSLNLDIRNNTDVCFILNIYGINENDYKYYLGYYLVKSNSYEKYEEQIDLKFCSKFNDIESTAYCNTFNNVKKEYDEFTKSKVKEIVFEVADYSTFANKKPRYSTTYRFEVRKCYLKKEG